MSTTPASSFANAKLRGQEPRKEIQKDKSRTLISSPRPAFERKQRGEEKGKKEESPKKKKAKKK
jgi:hypothetical protein